jgi:hypothetical protein
MRSYPRALKAMAEMGFDLNAQRDSDKCTPLHLAIFFKKLAAVRTRTHYHAPGLVPADARVPCGTR